MYKLPDSLSEDINYIDSLIRDYKAGKVEETRFKAIRVPMGIYEQRTNGTYMVRVRCSGGYIAPLQLKTVAQVALRDEIPYLHVTTRQEIQLHYADLDKVKEIFTSLQHVELGTKGGGGNTVRNIMADERAGIDAREVFDVYPYYSDLTTFLIAQNDSFTLPRKLKIAFSISEELPGYAVVNDLGFIPRIVDGERGFRVYLGGSVASRPTLGWLIHDFVPEKDFLRVAVAVKRFFSENGNRKNRHKARIRHIFYKLGVEETIRLYQTYFETAKKEPELDYVPGTYGLTNTIPAGTPAATDDEKAFRLWKERYATEQKQQGYYAVVLPLQHGNLTPEVLLKIAAFAEKFGNDTIRFTPRQHIQLRNIPEDWLTDLWNLIKEIGIAHEQPLLVNDVISCTGADTCRLGICLAKGAAKAVRNRLLGSNLPLDEAGSLQINISGCSNSCAQHIWSDLGFSGRVARNDRMYPAYSVYAKTEGAGELAQAIGAVSARDLPRFVEELLDKWLTQKEEYPVFGDYIRAVGKIRIDEILSRYAEIPSFEEDKNYYYDWGSEQVFSVSERGKAECSAGLFDMIDIDGNIIESSRKVLPEAADDSVVNDILYDIAHSASRMLLITRGAEPRSTAESYQLFEQLFIDAGLVDQRYKIITRAAQAKENLLPLREEILSLADAVVALYQTMDDSLQFKTSTGTPVAVVEKSPATPAGEAVVKDFRGVGCPMNFVKTKLALAPLPSGALLEILIDDGAPIENVPGSVRNEGHTIESTVQNGDYWRVVIRKK